MDIDKSGIGVARSARPILDLLEEKFFETKDAAFMACVTLAIARNLLPVDPGPVERTWHAGGNRQELLDFIAWHLKSTNPVKTMEQLGHAGLLHIKPKLEAGVPFEAIFAPV